MATQNIRPDRIVFAIPGTSETTLHADHRVELGMIAEATKLLSPELFEKYYLPYAAEYGNGTSYRVSRDRAVENLITLIVLYPGSEIYLIGYSQGAAIVTLAVKRIQSQVAADPEGNTGGAAALAKIKGIYLLANPHRQPGMIYGRDPGGEGIAFSEKDGWWGELKDLVMEITAPGDIIGSSDPNTTFLKRLPDYTIDMNWADLIGWAESIYHLMIRSNPFTLYPELRKQFGVLTYLSRYMNTVVALYNYIASNVHVKYAIYEVAEGQLALRAIANDIIDKAVVKNAS